ncbi:MAG TPA: DUF4232 domain-containing protein, partial [Streptomyces sp.]|nr:DUF4232 domain-containing protein [Streptomyces sp.]
MATHHARSVLAALAVGAALAATGCTAGPASSSNTPASAQSAEGDSGAEDPPAKSEPPAAESAEGKGAKGSGSPGRSGSGKARPPWCVTDTLSMSLRPGQPAAGSRYATLVLTNSSGAACRTQGWPGLQLTGKGGELIPTEVVRDHSSPSRALTLEVGQRASARLHWTVVPSEGDPSDGRCPEPRATRVIPPDQRTAKSIAWKL